MNSFKFTTNAGESKIDIVKSHTKGKKCVVLHHPKGYCSTIRILSNSFTKYSFNILNSHFGMKVSRSEALKVQEWVKHT